MNATDKARIADAIQRANAQSEQGQKGWNPVYCDLLIDDVKIGHIVSNGYGEHLSWGFIPVDSGRRPTRARLLDEAIPKWASKGELSNVKTYAEITEQQTKEVEEIKAAALDRLYTALEAESFPCNPIPFAVGLADHVREHGTDSIKTDDAKRILFILMGQAYGQLAKIDLSDEWDRLTKRGGTSHD